MSSQVEEICYEIIRVYFSWKHRLSVNSLIGNGVEIWAEYLTCEFYEGMLWADL